MYKLISKSQHKADAASVANLVMGKNTLIQSTGATHYQLVDQNGTPAKKLKFTRSGRDLKIYIEEEPSQAITEKDQPDLIIENYYSYASTLGIGENPQAGIYETAAIQDAQFSTDSQSFSSMLGLSESSSGWLNTLAMPALASLALASAVGSGSNASGNSSLSVVENTLSPSAAPTPPAPIPPAESPTPPTPTPPAPPAPTPPAPTPPAATAPTVTISLADSTLDPKQSTQVSFNFSEKVTGFSADDISAAGLISSLTSTDGGKTWTATYVSSKEDGKDTFDIQVKDQSYTNLTGTAGKGGTVSGSINDNNFLPKLTLSLSDSTLDLGQSTKVTMAFNEKVINFGLDDIAAPGALSGFTTIDGGKTWTADYKPSGAPGDTFTFYVWGGTNYTDTSGNKGPSGNISGIINHPNGQAQSVQTADSGAVLG